jgi:hypothetical protein
MRGLLRRLAAVETRLRPPSPHPQAIILRGGLHNGDPTFATSGGLRWERAAAEHFAEFCARAKAEAAAEGSAFVVFGGLPDVANGNPARDDKGLRPDA